MHIDMSCFEDHFGRMLMSYATTSYDQYAQEKASEKVQRNKITLND